MPLTPGTRLGPYEVIAAIGAGGMGEVYRARDTKLDRDVAIKTLPEAVAGDPDRLARFEREARVLAALNHPNIAQVYGFEHAADGHAIVMELVEGQTLAGVMAAESTVPLSRALDIARQIADALETAHDQGIVHRDLKPANVKVRDDGTVKVLDFGLAKALGPESSGASADAMANSPTLTARATELGVILGTAAYMAPEQAKGKAVDKRADVWAFGVVLFEMLTGQRAFQGEDISETLASVLAREPDLAALPADTPAPVRRLIARCLQKDPKKRLRDVGDAMRRLDEEMAEPEAAREASAATESGPTPSGWTRVLLPAAALLVGLLAGAYVLGGLFAPDEPADVMRFTEIPGGQGLWMLGRWPHLTISPDGRIVVYTTASEQGVPTLATRRIDEPEGAVLRGAQGAVAPFVSPDNLWVGFLSSNSLLKVSVLGGPAQEIVQAPSEVFGATWTDDDRVIFGTIADGLQEVSADGGDPVSLTTPEGQFHMWPSAIPGTPYVLFVEATGTPLAGGQLMVLDRDDGTVTSLNVSGASPRYGSSGHLLYAVEDGSVRGVAFDARTATVTGSPVPVIDGVVVNATGAADFAVSDNGRLVYVAGATLGERRQLVWVDREGRETPIAAEPRAYTYAWVSPDDGRLALDVRDQNLDIWVLDLSRETLQRRTFEEGREEYGIWTPDGAQLIFSDGINLFRRAADGTGQPTAITDEAAGTRFPHVVSPDGQVIYRSTEPGRQNDLFAVPLEGGEPRLLVGTEFNELNASLSPDGRWLAYESNATGTAEVYVRPFPDTNAGLEQLSTAGGTEPVWSRDGDEIFYVDGAQRLMRVPVDTTSGFVAGTPVVLFDAADYFFATLGRNYDVAGDGRFVMIRAVDTGVDQLPTISVVLNWFEVLKDIR